MRTELFRATLNPEGPNYETWRQIFHRDVPLQSPVPVMATLGENERVEVYLLQLQALTLGQRSKLLTIVAQKFGVPVYEVEKQFRTRGFPIRATDVHIAVYERAFG